MVSWTPHEALQTGHSKCSPGTCSSRNSKRLGSPSKRHSATRHCRPNPNAAVKSSSGVICLFQSTLTKKTILCSTPDQVQKLLRLRSAARNERRALEGKKQ